MEVLADGRVRRTRSEWEKILRRFDKSELGIAKFCEKESISRSAFTNWKRRLNGGLKKRPAFVEFTPVSVKSSATAPSDETDFELHFPGGVTLRWRG